MDKRKNNPGRPTAFKKQGNEKAVLVWVTPSVHRALRETSEITGVSMGKLGAIAIEGRYRKAFAKVPA